MEKPRYETFCAGQWHSCRKAAVQLRGQLRGWLHAELFDGTNTLCKPGTWRKIVKGESKLERDSERSATLIG